MRSPTGRATRLALVVTVALAVVGASCSDDRAGVRDTGRGSGEVDVVVTTEILADLADEVGGDRVEVTSIVPPGGDPHSYEPTPRDATAVSKADVAFSNHLLLEEHAMIRLLDNNVRKGVPNIDLAEQAERYGARLRPLVEDVTLDTVWLGLAVRGKGPDRSSYARLEFTDVRGPGDFHLYVTDALGTPEIYASTADGIDEKDYALLPPGAHTHLNWVFTESGRYDVDVEAYLGDETGRTGGSLGKGTYTFAVGVDPSTVEPGRQVIDSGHADASVDIDKAKVFICNAPLSCADQVSDIEADEAVIDVPNRAIVTLPDDRRFAFLGPAGSKVFELPQAVLGKHVHGEIDPHLWEDVQNAEAYVEVITDTLAEADPEGREAYEANRDRYVKRLEALDRYVTRTIGTIPKANRQLVTTHDAFGYLAAAYDMKVAGFVVPNPAQEPSAEQVSRLNETVKNLDVPAVFVEPNLAARATVLRQVAEDQDVRVCQIYGDSFDENVDTYVDMMRHNADELRRCLRRK